MNRKMLILIILAVMSITSTARKLPPIVGESVSLQVCIEDPTKVHGNNPRTPINPPAVSIDDHTLYTGAVWFDATLQILDEDENVVYTTFVPAGTPIVVLPSTLSGDYELRLILNNWYFYGYITL